MHAKYTLFYSVVCCGYTIRNTFRYVYITRSDLTHLKNFINSNLCARQLFTKTKLLRMYCTNVKKSNILDLFGTDSDQNRMLEEIPRSGSDSLPL